MSNPVIEEIYTSGLVRGTSGKAPRAVSESGMPREEGEAIARLVKQESAKSTLEVGFAVGLSAMFICDALKDDPEHRHVTIDPFQNEGYDGLGLENVTAAGFRDRITFYEESSHLALPRLESEGLRLDVAFIDGSHLFDYTLLEFFYIDRMLRPGGLVIFDDTWMPAVAKAVRFAVTNRGYTDESRGLPATGMHRVARRARRLARGLARLPAALGFAFGGERHEVDGSELPWPREHGLAVLRKHADDDRHWTHFESF